MAPPSSAPIKTAGMDPIDVAELLRKKIMRAKLSREQVNKLMPASLKAGNQCEGEGSIYTQALLQSTKKVIEDRKLNQDIYTKSGVARAVMGEVELINYGPCLIEMNQTEKARREQNKEVFTPDIYRSIYRSDNPNYAKCLVDDHGPAHVQRLQQEANKGAHSGDIFRNIVHGDARGSTAEYSANPCSKCPECVKEKSLKQKALQKEVYLKQNVERQQRFLEQKQQKELARLEAIAQHEKYQKQVQEFNADPRMTRLSNRVVTGI